MIEPSHRIIHDPNVLPALRDLFSQHPAMTQSGPEALSEALYLRHYLSYRLEPFEVEAALEVLLVDGEVLA
jgi:hypothetical protein